MRCHLWEFWQRHSLSLSLILGGRFGYFVYVVLGGRRRGVRDARAVFHQTSQEGGSPTGAEGVGGCLRGTLGEGLNMFSGPNSHQVLKMQFLLEFQVISITDADFGREMNHFCNA